MLTSLIHDTFRDVYNEQCQDFKVLSSFDIGNSLEDEESDVKSGSYFKPRQSSVAGPTIPFSISENGDTYNNRALPNDQMNQDEPIIIPLADDSGWKCGVSTQNITAETSSVCTMSHVFVPFTETSSITSALSMAIGESPSSSLANSRIYYNSIPDSPNTFGSSSSMNIFGSLTKNGPFSINAIRNSLASSSIKKHNIGAQRRLSATRCHEDVMFHTSDMFSSDNDFLSNNLSLSLGTDSAYISDNATGYKGASTSYGTNHSPIASSEHSLSSSYSNPNSFTNFNARTATTLPLLPQLKHCLDSGVFDTGKKKRNGSFLTPSSLTDLEAPSVSSKSKFMSNTSWNTYPNATNFNETTLSTDTLSSKHKAEPLMSNTETSKLNTLNEASDFAQIFTCRDTTSAASFFSMFGHLEKQNSNQQTNEFSPNSSTASDSSCLSYDSSITYEYVAIPEKSALCIDVSPLELSDMSKFGSVFLEPIVLPPIVGHINEFHPDFAVQACLSSENLGVKITQAMHQDSLAFTSDEDEIASTITPSSNSPHTDVSSNTKAGTNSLSNTTSPYIQSSKPLSTFHSPIHNTADTSVDDDTGEYENVKEIVSKTLVIDLHSLEIVEHILVRDDGTNQNMYCNQLFAKGKPVSPAIEESIASVESQLSSLISHILKKTKSPELGPLPEASKEVIRNDEEHDGVNNKHNDGISRNQGETDNLFLNKRYFSSNNQLEKTLKRCYDSRFNLLKF